MKYIDFKYEVILDPDYIKRTINILNENEYINKVSFPLLWLDIDNKVCDNKVKKNGPFPFLMEIVRHVYENDIIEYQFVFTLERYFKRSSYCVNTSIIGADEIDDEKARKIANDICNDDLFKDHIFDFSDGWYKFNVSVKE